VSGPSISSAKGNTAVMVSRMNAEIVAGTFWVTVGKQSNYNRHRWGTQETKI